MQCFVSVLSLWEQFLLLVVVSFTALRSIVDMHFSLLVLEIWRDFLDQAPKSCTFIVTVGCLLLLWQVRFCLQPFSQLILPKIVNKIVKVISAIKGKNRGGSKEEEDEIKLKCKFVPILSFSLIRSKGGKHEKLLKTQVILKKGDRQFEAK